MAEMTETLQSVEEVKEQAKDPEKRKELEERVASGETVVKGGTGGKSLEAQIHLAEGRSKGGHSTMEKSGEERFEEKGYQASV